MSGFRQLLQNGPFVRMTVSRNGKLIACFTEAGTARRTSSSPPPSSFSWSCTDGGCPELS
jgi:hypothetical protein